MNERMAVSVGAVIGALVGGAASYLFFTERGQVLRDRLEPAVDDLRREFTRFQGTIEQVGRMANDGMRAVQEFNAARVPSQFTGDGTSH